MTSFMVAHDMDYQVSQQSRKWLHSQGGFSDREI